VTTKNGIEGCVILSDAFFLYVLLELGWIDVLAFCCDEVGLVRHIWVLKVLTPKLPLDDQPEQTES
jgi:hypothetical protein